ncbi:hypothetical protein [Mycobacteroides abscessus]|uniref:hypothetical protein n=1 Tax=Mycobacteroides abscessus TaxID=36809 RepID=UPI0009296C9A|nr:hypothetical protein [Mycobacteroides abscessus]SII75993.1 Uncharacterised protein [Mycobacteroides abscessus subsp. abscessus]
MDILNETQRRLLTYIYAANSGGYSPTPDEVTEWVLRPDLVPGKVTIRRVKSPGWATIGAIPNVMESPALKKLMDSVNADMRESMKPFMEHVLVSQPGLDYATLFPAERLVEEREPDETLVEQAQRLGWVQPSATGAGLVLTNLGRALLRNDADMTTASEITVLEGDDPLAWGALVETIADAGACVIVDPYLKPEQFLEVAKFTGTTRVILRRPASANSLIPWQMYQALPDVQVEVRVADPQLLHDRYIVGETAVYQLGCSLNGVGRKPTTLVPLTGPVADFARSHVEELWKSAAPVGDPPVGEDEAEDADSANG